LNGEFDTKIKDEEIPKSEEKQQVQKEETEETDIFQIFKQTLS
jgi:hypothetical protein